MPAQRLLFPLLLLLALSAAAHPADEKREAVPPGTAAATDTTIVVDRVQVTAIKQGAALRTQPVAATVVGSRAVGRSHIDAVKDLSRAVPNFHAPDYGSRMTSSIYIRGLGARIDQPVAGLNIDNVPVFDKNCFDTELADIERIEVLRGPQSTLYGRNTMGGVINIYTRSPLAGDAIRLLAKYGSGNSGRLRASLYRKLRPGLGMSVTGYYTRTDGFFENAATGERCDRERMGGGRWRTQWRGSRGLQIDNTFSFSLLEQGGYPYAYAGEEIVRDGRTIIRPGEIRYNDPCSYRRTAVSDGLTIRCDAGRFSVASITGYQYFDDTMILDQDFTPLSCFTLRQSRRDHAVTEDLVFRSHDDRPYRWLAGLFGFYRHGTMEAPVLFKKDGIDELIFANANAGAESTGLRFEKRSDELPLESEFRNPVYGFALYHESSYVAGRWRFTAGIRADYERTRLRYASRAEMPYGVSVDGGASADGVVRIDDRRSLAHSYTEILPKFSVLYAFDGQRNLYVSVAKGYKAGGFNTQMFSDILQEKLKWQMVSGLVYEEPDLMSYKPEYSWNYELGGRFAWLDGALRGDFALFLIDCRDQQLTVFPEGSATGRMMTNAGRTRAQGVELSLQAILRRNLEFDAAYGFTHAEFVRYNDGIRNYRGKELPYAPRHTLSAQLVWTIPTGISWLGDLVLRGGMQGTGRIRWNEENTRTQPFYALFDASLRIEHARYSIDIGGRNLGGRRYDLFYFKSVGREFVQHGRPRTFAITLTLNID